MEKSEPILTKLYNGKVEIKFFPDSHIYFINGKRKGSVTGALGIIDKSRALIPWAVDMYSDYLRERIGMKIDEEIINAGEEQWNIKKAEAAGIGVASHSWIEKFVKGQKPEMPEDKNVLQAITGFLNWIDDHKVKFIESEKLVYSKKHDYVGCMDATATFNGKRKKFVIDYKVSNGLYPGVALQTAAYLMADTEESGTEYEGRWAIRLSKETESEYMERMEKKQAKWCRKNPGKKPYDISPYMPFEARYLDDGFRKVERDYEAFVKATELSNIYRQIDQEFFDNR